MLGRLDEVVEFRKGSLFGLLDAQKKHPVLVAKAPFDGQ
jgi:hypothetical protein